MDIFYACFGILALVVICLTVHSLYLLKLDRDLVIAGYEEVPIEVKVGSPDDYEVIVKMVWRKRRGISLVKRAAEVTK